MSEKPEKVVPAKAIGFKLPDYEYRYKANGPILYALGIGFSTDPLDRRDLSFTYELSDDFRVFPTFATSFLDIAAIGEGLAACPGLPDFNPMNLLYGVHSLVLYQQLKPENVYYQSMFLEDVQDKEKGALVTIRTDSFEDKEHKKPVLTSRSSFFIRGLGGFDPQRANKPIVRDDIPPIPKDKPTFTARQPTTKNQALVFRLSGDFNPLHADPSMAEIAGFPAPILHGLATYGITAKLVLEKAAQMELANVEKVTTKFVGHIFPGETIVLSGWTSKDGRSVVFEATTEERKKPIAVGQVSFKAQLQPKL